MGYEDGLKIGLDQISLISKLPNSLPLASFRISVKQIIHFRFFKIF